jgi:sugar lactone lactonase YvrE
VEARTPTVLLDGIVFPESPRWHQDRLWFVDMFGGRVMTVDLNGRSEVIASFDDRPSGLGFLPNGSPIVVLMGQRRIVRLDNGEVHADLSELGGEFLNDMVVDNHGRAYVDCLYPRPDPTQDAGDSIVMVELNGSFRVVAKGGLFRPNGLVITPDGRNLVVAMGPIHSLMAYTVHDDGSLSDQRLYAGTKEEGIDGICLDAAGAVWIASPRTGHFVRVLPSGEFDQIVNVEGKWATACMLGGHDRLTLFMTTAKVPENPKGGLGGNLHKSTGFIEVMQVNVPGAGLP